MKKTIYSDITLSDVKTVYDPWQGYSSPMRVRTRSGKSLMRKIGECLKGGGDVDLTTDYVGDREVASATLYWEGKQ